MTMDEEENGSINGNPVQPQQQQQELENNGGHNSCSNIEWAFSQVKGTLDDEIADSKSFFPRNGI